MSDPYLGEIKLFSFAKIPTGWSLCNGAMVPVQQNYALFSLIGNRFGGDQTKFGLPDLQGRTPLGLTYGSPPGPNRSAYPTVGASGGAESVQLTIATVPAHTHAVYGATAQATEVTPTAGLLASPVSFVSGSTTDFSIYQPAGSWTGDATLAPGTISTAGAGEAHSNMQPFQVLSFCIATSNAVYPMRKQ